ncbi:MAG: ribosomal protein Thx [Bacteroidota bacterium]|jgi:ribosomal small subunit protein bTHX
MGRGDRRTTKGKISAGSFGISRPQKVKKAETATATKAATKKK